jgi:molecular chaperone GrpE
MSAVDPGSPAGEGPEGASGSAAAGPGDSSQAEGAGEETAGLRAALAAAQAKAEENHELYLRARAETENVRRRLQEDITKTHKFAIESFAEALVPVCDSLEKALADAGTNADVLKAGVEITLRQLRAAFERGRLIEINPLGEKFDPYRHQAISASPGDGTLPPNHVLAVLQKGWMISDRVLRPALVTVVQAGG